MCGIVGNLTEAVSDAIVAKLFWMYPDKLVLFFANNIVTPLNHVCMVAHELVTITVFCERLTDTIIVDQGSKAPFKIGSIGPARKYNGYSVFTHLS